MDEELAISLSNRMDHKLFLFHLGSKQLQVLGLIAIQALDRLFVADVVTRLDW